MLFLGTGHINLRYYYYYYTPTLTSHSAAAATVAIGIAAMSTTTEPVVQAEGGRCCRRCPWLLKLADFKLTCNNLSDVCRRQKGMPLVVFFLYRLLLAAYFFSFLIYFLVVTGRGTYGAKVLIYLTDWTFIEVSLYFCVAFANVLVDLVMDYKNLDRASQRFRYQLQWLLFNISITVSLIVTLVYWPILRPMIPANELPPLYMDFSIHLFPSIFCLLDLLVTRVTIRFAHALYPFLFVFAYGLFTIIYWAAGGTDPQGNPYIYPITDLEDAPGIAVATMFGVIVAVLVLHAILGLLSYLRCRYVDLGSRASTAQGEMEAEREPLLRGSYQQVEEIA